MLSRSLTSCSIFGLDGKKRPRIYFAMQNIGVKELLEER